MRRVPISSDEESDTMEELDSDEDKLDWRFDFLADDLSAQAGVLADCASRDLRG